MIQDIFTDKTVKVVIIDHDLAESGEPTTAFLDRWGEGFYACGFRYGAVRAASWISDVFRRMGIK